MTGRCVREEGENVSWLHLITSVAEFALVYYGGQKYYHPSELTVAPPALIGAHGVKFSRAHARRLCRTQLYTTVASHRIMPHLSAEAKHHILLEYTPRSATHGFPALAARHAVSGGARTVQRWHERWDRTPQSLQEGERLLDSVREKTGTEVSLRTLRRYGQGMLATMKRGVKRTAEEMSSDMCEQIANVRRKLQRIGTNHILFLDETYKREGDVQNYSIILPGESSSIESASTSAYSPRYDMIACCSGTQVLPPKIFTPKERGKGVTAALLQEYVRDLLVKLKANQTGVREVIFGAVGLSGRDGFREGRHPSDDVKCWRCGERGHVKREFPKGQTAVADSDSEGSTGGGDSESQDDDSSAAASSGYDRGKKRRAQPTDKKGIGRVQTVRRVVHDQKLQLEAYVS